MSCCLDVLRWIFGGKKDEELEEATSRNWNTYSQINLSDTQTGYGSCRSLYSSNDSIMISQYDPQFHLQSDAHQNYSNSSKFPRTSVTPTDNTSRGISSIKPGSCSVERISEKPREISRPLPPSPSPSHVSQSKATNPVINKPSEQGLPRNASPFSSKPSPSLSEPPAYSSKQSPHLSSSGRHSSLPKPTPTSSSTSYGTPSSSSKPPPLTNKPTLTLASPSLTNQRANNNYIRVDKGASPIYAIPEDIKGLIEKDIVPGVLRKPLSTSTYKDYFEALLYAEDYYLEKWDGFKMENVTLKLHEAAIYTKKGKYKDLNKLDEKDDKIFVAFEIDSIPERRPFLLSRDFASVRPSGRNVEPFQGIIYRVVKSNLVLVEFGEDFHSQHYSACKYTVKFSFNRVCLKRAHQAIAASSDPLFLNFLFPDVPRNSLTAFQVLPINHKLDGEKVSAVRQILGLKSPPPYLVEGSPSVTGMVVKEAVVQIYRSSPSCRILICAPINRTCDVLMRGLKKEIPESELFRANAAFRELDEVPPDILTSCPLKGECFSCPSLQELQKFKVILSTFMSSFRLHNEGIMAGHFSHIFLVDASSATEPETMVVLANLANEKTAVVITGAPWRHSSWVRSKIARENGLMTSYFERLCESKLYESLNPKFITRLQD